MKKNKLEIILMTLAGIGILTVIIFAIWFEFFAELLF